MRYGPTDLGRPPGEKEDPCPPSRRFSRTLRADRRDQAQAARSANPAPRPRGTQGRGRGGSAAGGWKEGVAGPSWISTGSLEGSDGAGGS